jgi:hypothetical protein
MQLMLQAHDTLFRVWELAVSFLGLPPLPLVPREKHESQANFPTANDLDCRRTWRPVPRLLMRTVRNSALNNLRLNLSAARIFPRQFPPDSRRSGLLT